MDYFESTTVNILSFQMDRMCEILKPGEIMIFSEKQIKGVDRKIIDNIIYNLTKDGKYTVKSTFKTSKKTFLVRSKGKYTELSVQKV
jgi:hypothetical protein